MTTPTPDDLTARMAAIREAPAALIHRDDLAYLLDGLTFAVAQRDAARAEAGRLREAFSNLLSEHTQSDDAPAFWLIHESDFVAAGRMLTTFEHTETDSARGQALLAVVAAAREADGEYHEGPPQGEVSTLAYQMDRLRAALRALDA